MGFNMQGWPDMLAPALRTIGAHRPSNFPTYCGVFNKYLLGCERGLFCFPLIPCLVLFYTDWSSAFALCLQHSKPAYHHRSISFPLRISLLMHRQCRETG